MTEQPCANCGKTVRGHLGNWVVCPHCGEHTFIGDCCAGDTE